MCFGIPGVACRAIAVQRCQCRTTKFHVSATSLGPHGHRRPQTSRSYWNRARRRPCHDTSPRHTAVPDRIANPVSRLQAPRSNTQGWNDEITAVVRCLASVPMLGGSTTHESLSESEGGRRRDLRSRRPIVAGVTAGLDLALALDEEDLGRTIAMKLAAQLVMYFTRPGGQRQFRRSCEAPLNGRSAQQELHHSVFANLAETHNVSKFADRLSLSTRHLTRLFHQEMWMTPTEWVLSARLSVAREMLESGQHTPKEAALKCGFSGPNTMRRAFVRQFGISPAAYRRRYATATTH